MVPPEAPSKRPGGRDFAVAARLLVVTIEITLERQDELHEELQLAAARWLALRHRHAWPAVGRRTACITDRAGCALDRSVRLWRGSSRKRSHVWGSWWLGLVGRQRGYAKGTRRHRTGVGASQCTQLADCSPAAFNAPHAPATGPQTRAVRRRKSTIVMPTPAALHIAFESAV